MSSIEVIYYLSSNLYPANPLDSLPNQLASQTPSLYAPVGCVHIKTFAQVYKTFGYLARFHARVDQLLQQHRVEFVNLFNVRKEYLQFVQA